MHIKVFFFFTSFTPSNHHLFLHHLHPSEHFTEITLNVWNNERIIDIVVLIRVLHSDMGITGCF
jgi:hypothetical protein